MSILSGFFKTIKYRMTDQGYKWQSEKTSSQTVVMGDGTDNTDTAEKRFGAIKGLTSSTSVTDTGYALDATIGKKHEDSIAALNQSLDNIQSHVGMIIQSTTLDTEAKVIAIYGGTKWTKIEGRFLLGASSAYKVNSTGGAATHNISVREMPSHAHSVNAVNTGGNNVGHTHRIPSLSGSTSSAGNHNHYTFNYGGNGYWYGSDWGNGTSFSCASSPTTQDKPTTSTNGAHTHSVTTNASTTGNQSANHVHTVPAHNTNANGSGSAMSIMPPYKAVYIWERIA